MRSGFQPLLRGLLRPGRGGGLAGVVAAAALVLSGPARALEVPTGPACLPGSAVAPRCRELVITNQPPYPESQTPQLPVQSFDPAFTEIVGRIPDLVPLATGFGFLEGPVPSPGAAGRRWLVVDHRSGSQQRLCDALERPRSSGF